MLISFIDWAYTASSTLMIIFYLPQLWKVIKAPPPLNDIAISTWLAWAVCIFISFLYGFHVIHDLKYALFSLLGSGCCFSIASITFFKRRRMKSEATIDYKVCIEGKNKPA